MPTGWPARPGAVAEVLNAGEQVLYRELQARVAGRRVMLAPKMRVLVDPDSFKPVAAVELDGVTHEQDPLTMARDRLKNSLCEKAGLALVRVHWGDWGALGALETLLRG